MKRINAQEARNILAKNLNDNLNKFGKRKSDVGRDLGISEATVRSWFNGQKYPRIDKLQLLADYFHTTRSALTDENKFTNTNSKFGSINARDFVQVPLLGEIACGEPITADQNIDGYIPTEKSDLPTGTSFWLTCKGNSMSPTLPNGSIVLVHEQPKVEDGEMAAVLIDDEATLKRVKHIDGNKILLMPDNNSYEPILLDGTTNARILGKVIEMKMKF